ncbi:MAG: DUF1641 domain-containing protein [Deltaproteobacteria bacterium]|jgi:uncharacterized protein YjgD (DUF1641 family)|nr:DUF1641 domain-containing protein [Deltaproteobacteria bacterium]MBW2238219.1 DUF1641 domain-containing protein [Deltaproteobacteria bacterium]MBW2571068.1 DUF1641 domain-containing protein [Deltaproteobacteria bacterium]MBW2669109.1 DUF1641 domain-containing protein [Deltaproteobacteria bacterium]MBW2711837.1 DUF1641 domain-containing protein [Deltaproteobacteria bacterium]
MTNEELILERLDRIESRIAPLSETAISMKEFKNDLMAMAQPVSKSLIKDLESVESAFQLEDLGVLSKRMLRSIKHIIYALDQLENITDFVTTVEPVLRLMVPQIIEYLNDLEESGVFRIIKATYDIRAKIATAYTAEDIEQIGDGLVALLGVAKKLSDPQLATLLENLAEVGAIVDLTKSKDVGPFGFFSACSGPESKRGLGVLIELTKALGKLKENGDIAASVEK